RVTHLRHVALGVTSSDDWVDFAEQDWGLEIVARSPDLCYFAAAGSPEPFVLRLRRSDGNRLDHISFGASSIDDLVLIVQRAGERDCLIGPAEVVERPGGGRAMRLFDPDGRVIEVATEVADRVYREVGERESIPKSISHVVVNTPQM